MNQIMKEKGLKKGFTLIELLVVIAIIGILASVVLASLNSARAKSRDARRIADVKQLQLALELFADANGQTYPTTTEFLGDATTPSVLTTGCSGACIATLPKPPAGANQDAYAYEATPVDCDNSTTDCTGYQLGAVLEEATNQALTGDVDSTVGFEGKSVDCGTTSGDDSCYDITN